MKQRYTSTLASVAAALLAHGALGADNSTVTSTGTATLQKPPTMVRVTCEITANGKDAAEALTKLTQLRSDLKTKLQALGPIDGVAINDPSFGTGTGLSERQQQMQMLMAMNRGGKKPEANTVTVSARIKAAFPLNSASPDDLLIKAREIEDKIRGIFTATNSAATPATKPASAEEQEVAEEMVQQQQPDMPGLQKPGEPHFAYVFPVDDNEAVKVTSQALADARSGATVLATASGLKLGDVVTLRPGTDAGSQNNPYADYIESVTQAVAPPKEPGVREGTGDDPGNVRYEVAVSVTYALKP